MTKKDFELIASALQAGPFASSQQAHEDADEWAPEYDEEVAS